MDIKEIGIFLKEDMSAVRQFMCDSLSTDVTLLDEVNRSILSHTGKQLRPMTALLIARACNGGRTSNRAVCYAAAAELLHNATLLHDDVVDDSPQRRGQPTTQAVVGSKASVLVGDFWLVKVMDVLMNYDTPDRKVSRVFSRTFSDLAEGEMLQLQKAGKGDTSIEDYQRIIFCKTASLFEAACQAAAISSGASDELEKAAMEFGRNFGIAFQIKDDILDYDGGDIGKPVGMDLLEQKMTLPLLGAMEVSDDNTKERVRSMVCDILSHPENVREISDFVHSKDGVGYAHDKLVSYAAKAVEALSPMPECEEKEMLKSLAEFLIYRQK